MPVDEHGAIQTSDESEYTEDDGEYDTNDDEEEYVDQEDGEIEERALSRRPKHVLLVTSAPQSARPVRCCAVDEDEEQHVNEDAVEIRGVPSSSASTAGRGAAPTPPAAASDNLCHSGPAAAHPPGPAQLDRAGLDRIDCTL